jgi:RNA polymerase I-specific transcription initiation factor RRN6
MFKVSVLVSSSKTLLVNFYTFSERSGTPTSFQGSFSFSTDVKSQGSSYEMLQALCFLRAPLTSTPSRTPGTGLELMEQNVKFYQVWALTPGLALRWTLCAVYDISAGTSPSKVHITAPTVRSFLRRLLASGDIVVDNFIVPDDFASGDEDDRASPSHNYKHHQQFEKTQVHLQPWVDWRGVFHRLFLDNTHRNQADTSLVNSFQNMTELTGSVLHRIDEGMGSDSLPMASL